MHTTRLTIKAVLLVAPLLGGLCLMSAPAKADVAAAGATFKTKCAGCHGANGEGKDVLKTRDLGSADVQKMSDADLTSIIKDGKGKMPPFKALTADQLKDMVGYIRSLKK